MNKCYLTSIGLALVSLSFSLGVYLTDKPNYKTVKPSDFTEITCIAHGVYHESRGEPYEGQLAVAYVIVNRARDTSFPPHACDVIYQKHQFTDITKTKPNLYSKAWNQAIVAAQAAYYGLEPDPTKGSKFFYAPKVIKKPRWANKPIFEVQIGQHKFIDIASN
jgi:spore germination cell wall hydrolase CwlJ-like protein